MEAANWLFGAVPNIMILNIPRVDDGAIVHIWFPDNGMGSHANLMVLLRLHTFALTHLCPFLTVTLRYSFILQTIS